MVRDGFPYLKHLRSGEKSHFESTAKHCEDCCAQICPSKHAESHFGNFLVLVSPFLYLLEILCTVLYWHRIAQFWPWKDGESYWGWEAECQDNVHLSSRWSSQLTKVTKM